MQVLLVPVVLLLRGLFVSSFVVQSPIAGFQSAHSNQLVVGATLTKAETHASIDECAKQCLAHE